GRRERGRRHQPGPRSARPHPQHTTRRLYVVKPQGADVSRRESAVAHVVTAAAGRVARCGRITRVRAAGYSAVAGPVTMQEVEDPRCPAGGAVIRVRATGICRSDWHAWRGHDPVPLPHIGGHEYAGEVVEAGREVTRFAAGDRVTVPF